MHVLANVSKRKRKFLEQARKIANNSNFSPHRHGAILVKGGSILSSSFNKNKFNRFADRFCTHDGHGTIHAELGCILGLDKSITSGSKIFVVRINKENYFKNSRPCDMCFACLRHVGIKKVYYSIDEERIGLIRIK